MNYSWTGIDTWCLKAQAKDTKDALSDWSSMCQIIISANSPPNIPSTPIGPDTGFIAVSYNFNTFTTDPEGDGIYYIFDWDDGEIDTSAVYPSDDSVSMSHVWSTVMTYTVKVRAYDTEGAISEWSAGHPITIISPNNPPNKPTIPAGPSLGLKDTLYTFSSSASDPDGDDIAIRFDWGDGDTSDWSNFTASGKTISINHAWSDFGFHNVKTQAKDTAGAISDWSNSYQIEIYGLKWRYFGRVISSSPAIGSDSTIYFGTRDYRWGLVVLNHDGTLKWRRFTAANGSNSSPALGQDGIIYIGSEEMYLHAVNPDGSLKWRFPTGNLTVYSSPAIGLDGTIYFGGTNGYFYALNPDSTLKWSFVTGAGIEASPAIGSDGTIYFGSYNGFLYALNRDGSLKWTYQTGGSIASSPAIGQDGTIYFGSNDNYIWALNPDGTFKWSYQTENYVGGSPAIGIDGTIYCGSYDNYLYALNSDGSLKWHYLMPGDLIESSPTIGPDGTIYIGSWNQYLYAIQSSGQLANTPWPMFRHDLKHTGRVGGGR